MTSEPASSGMGTQRTRRNIMKMGAIAVPAMLATVHSASAGEGPICTVLGWFGIECPPTIGNGNGNGGHNGNCFLRGTKILTSDGERNIEDLAVGDLLPTMFGGLRPVQWIGRYPYKKSDPSKPWAESVLPVRIARSALGPNVPNDDLYVTALHSVLIDGVLVPAEKLINGATITRYEPEGDEMEFFHIKLESHDVIYAEGAPAETLSERSGFLRSILPSISANMECPRQKRLAAPHMSILGAAAPSCCPEPAALSRLGLICATALTSFATGWRKALTARSKRGRKKRRLISWVSRAALGRPFRFRGMAGQ